jgi:hypothetical protein
MSKRPPTLPTVPHVNPEAERAALGALLIAGAGDQELAARILSLLRSADFYELKHATIFEGISALAASARPVDVVLLDEWLRAEGRLANVGGSAYIHQLANTCVSAYDGPHYAEIVLNNAVGRGRIAALNDAMLGKLTDVEVVGRLDALARRLDGTSQARSETHWRPVVQTAQALLQKVIAPARWAVEDLIAEGVTLLAAKPKKGKTVLMLNLSGSVAVGACAIGALKTTMGDVLYLALEDNEVRMQRRLQAIYAEEGETPSRLHIAYEWLPLDRGGLDALDEWMDAYPTTRLIVIDTLEHVRAERTSSGSVYADDYKAVRELQRWAGRRRVSVVAIHHLRKGGADDPLDEVSGSTGLTGGVDNILLMRSVSGMTELARRGRDYGDDSALALKGDPALLTWTLAGKAEDVLRSDAQKAILDVLQGEKDGLWPREIAESLDPPKRAGTVRFLLKKMKDAPESLLEVLANGKYRLSGAAETADDRGSVSTPMSPLTAEEGAGPEYIPTQEIPVSSLAPLAAMSNGHASAGQQLVSAEVREQCENGATAPTGLGAAAAKGEHTSAPPHLHNGNGRTPEWLRRYKQLVAQGLDVIDALALAMNEANENDEESLT